MESIYTALMPSRATIPARSAGARFARDHLRGRGLQYAPNLDAIRHRSPGGIGDPAVRIQVRLDLPVGKNLQDRYEVGVVNRMKEDWEVLTGAKFRKGDAQYRQWLDQHGAYITNGGVLIVIKRSTASKLLPDLLCLGLLAKFRGYFPGYSKLITDYPNYLSWVVLKAHTLNASGTVRFDPPIRASRRTSTSTISTKTATRRRRT